MIYAAEVNNGVVVRVAVLSGNSEDNYDLIEVGECNTVGVGWLYKSGLFFNPQDEEDPA